MHNPDSQTAIGDARYWASLGFIIIPTTTKGWPLINPADWDKDYQPETALARLADYPESSVGAFVPPGCVAILAPNEEAAKAQQAGLSKLAVPPSFWADLSGGARIALYRLAEGVGAADISPHFGNGVVLLTENLIMPLPSGALKAGQVSISSVDELPELGLHNLDTAEPQPLVADTPLQDFTLLGHAAELESNAQAACFLLAYIALMGQFTVLYGPPNAGKTLLTIALLLWAIEDRRVHAGNCYYINADDNQAGLAEKARLLEDAGVHMLAPGYQGFEAGKLEALIRRSIDEDKCAGVVIFLDTMKAFVDLMNKGDARRVGRLIREFVSKGGTVIGTAHVNKKPDAKGGLTYAGTTDLTEEADAYYLLVPLEERAPDGAKIVQFQVRKRRGANADQAYSYTDEAQVSYAERLASVNPVTGAEFDKFAEAAVKRSDTDVIDAVRTVVEAGTVTKMDIAKTVAARLRIGRQQVIRVLERHEGPEPGTHEWAYSVGGRGAKIYSLHQAPG